MTVSSQLDLRSAAIALLLLALVLYGSLYPFLFYSSDVPGGPLVAFWAPVHEPLDRGDVISNILIYLPLGFFAVRCFPRRPALVRFAMVALSGTVLAISIELTQFYDVGRDPSVVDAAANAAGATIGAAAGVLIRRISGPMLLLAAWLGARSIPFFPSLNVHKWALALRPVFVTPYLEPLQFLSYFALWLAAAALLEAIFRERRGRPALIVAILLVFVARIVVIDLSLSVSEVAGAAAAGILWTGVLWRLESRGAIVCALFIAFVTLDALRPFHFEHARRAFGWLPFRSFIDGPRESGSRTFLEKTFIYGGLVWLMRRAGLSLAIATLATFALVFTLRLIQTYLPGRSAEITDPAMVLIFAGFLAFLPD
jgi:VanZ family protein